MRLARLGVALLGGAALALAVPIAASAADPVDLGGAYVFDEAGVLGGDLDEVEAALDELYERTQTQLFVVLVDEFENPGDPGSWANDTANANGLGATDVLLAIAVEDRAYDWSVDESFELSAEDLHGVATDRMVPEFRDDDWAGGLIAVADGIGDRLTGEGGFPVLPVLGGAAVLGVGGYVVSRVVKRRRAASAAEADQRDLDRRAGALLVALDDALESNRQELGFAIAQFGADATTDFRTAIESAEAQAKEAFAIRQRLDDAHPETAQERRQLTEEIIRLCEAADATLDAQTEAFEQLRQLEARASAASILAGSAACSPATVSSTSGARPSRTTPRKRASSTASPGRRSSARAPRSNRIAAAPRSRSAARSRRSARPRASSNRSSGSRSSCPSSRAGSRTPSPTPGAT